MAAPAPSTAPTRRPAAPAGRQPLAGGSHAPGGRDDPRCSWADLLLPEVRPLRASKSRQVTTSVEFVLLSDDCMSEILHGIRSYAILTRGAPVRERGAQRRGDCV